MWTEANKRAKAKYELKIKQYHIGFNSERHADVIAMLDSVSNKQGYIRELIRNDMKDRKLFEKYKKKY